MKFEEWKAWKEKQIEPTCDHIGCTRRPVWSLPKQEIYFCAEHGNYLDIQRLYGEKPLNY